MRGLASTCEIPKSLPTCVHRLKESGVTHFFIGKWCEEGFRYCPMVTMSQATAARSVKHWSISDSFSPKPTIKDVLVIKLAFLALARTARLLA